MNCNKNDKRKAIDLPDTLNQIKIQENCFKMCHSKYSIHCCIFNETKIFILFFSNKLKFFMMIFFLNLSTCYFILILLHIVTVLKELSSLQAKQNDFYWDLESEINFH